MFRAAVDADLSGEIQACVNKLARTAVRIGKKQERHCERLVIWSRYYFARRKPLPFIIHNTRNPT